MRLKRRALVFSLWSLACGALLAPPALADDAPAAAAAPVDAGQAATTPADAKQVWVRQVIGRIQASRARHGTKLRYDGRVLISFTVGWDGQLLDSRISSSSGRDALDAEAMAILRGAAPFPPVPSSLGSDKVALTLPIHFVRTSAAGHGEPPRRE